MFSTGKCGSNMVANMYHEFKVLSVPSGQYDKSVLFDSFGSMPFYVVYDVSTSNISVRTDCNDAHDRIDFVRRALPGIDMGRCCDVDGAGRKVSTYIIMSAYRVEEKVGNALFADIFDLKRKEGRLAVAFIPTHTSSLGRVKGYIERVLSTRAAGATMSVQSGIMGRRTVSTSHTENFGASEEAMLLGSLLESMNRSIVRNGIVYKVYLILENATNELIEYIRSRTLVLAERKIESWQMPAPKELETVMAVPIGIDVAGRFLNFELAARLSYTLKTVSPFSAGRIDIGTFVKDGVYDTRKRAVIQESTLNLGMVLSGLPGSGKTQEAMSIIESVISGMEPNAKPHIAIVSPTDEWNTFAYINNMNLVSLYDDCTPINFFRCPKGVEKSRFYETMAMILSSASNAGPYRNPMEKCMLNAFRRTYANTLEPDPVDVYEAIENSIVEFHGKRTGGNTKYTKHGENIRSALENLRSILCRTEYCARRGVDIGDLVRRGAVFDMSRVSISSKPYMYALVLNQIYATASIFSTDSDGRLNLLMCLEEAHTIFRDRDSAAVQDLKYRVQDFRKQGIGLMLLTHNANDIEASIRRLCQIKLYLKQAPDVAELAANDLTFTHSTPEEVAHKLKHLDARICAFSYVVKEGDERITHDTVFIRTKDRTEMHEDIASKRTTRPKMHHMPKKIMVNIFMNAQRQNDNKNGNGTENVCTIRLFYLGEKVAELEVAAGKTAVEMIEGKKYRIEVVDVRGRVCHSTYIVAVPEVNVLLPSAKPGLYKPNA